MSRFMNACALSFKVLILPLYIAEHVGLLSFFKRVFPMIQYKATDWYNNKMNDKKRELFRNLERFQPPEGSLRILEVGCGSGANFEHYPTGSKITCTDPNPHFKKYLEKSMEKNEHLEYDNFIVASGENLQAVEDSSVDAVVCTLVLCSVKDTNKVLQESKRVLRPGGALFFLEHVVSDPSTWAYFFQHVLEPLWYFFGDGCEVTRATWKHIEAAGFSDVKLHHIQAPLFFMLKPHIVGYAVK
nr:methyltransferase-like protein 7A [Danio rerio]|eukprot:XP_021327508.1 methyltransferase-like protein 7A [Danio rerio]